jgi:hypothetical protein
MCNVGERGANVGYGIQVARPVFEQLLLGS